MIGAQVVGVYLCLMALVVLVCVCVGRPARADRRRRHEEQQAGAVEAAWLARWAPAARPERRADRCLIVAKGVYGDTEP